MHIKSCMRAFGYMWHIVIFIYIYACGGDRGGNKACKRKKKKKDDKDMNKN